MYYTIMNETPVGPLLLAGDESGLRYLHFQDATATQLQIEDSWELSDRRLKDAVRQLRLYFRRQLTTFDLPLAPEGTEFQKRVWQALCNVPFGQTASYGQIASAIGNPAASRAVGLANGRNPIAIVIPCHRIIGSTGRLVGFGGGMRNKRALLELEGTLAPGAERVVCMV